MYRYTYYTSEWAVDALERNYIRCFPNVSEWTTQTKEEFEKEHDAKVSQTEFKLILVSGAV